MSVAALVASGSWLRPCTDAARAPLDTELMRLCAWRPRRASRFAQLALLGAARCLAGRELMPESGLYLASVHGALSATGAAHESIIRDGLLPRPVDFINTLGSISGFHIAARFGLRGPVICVSGDGGALFTALDAALQDLASGVVPQALVGVAEETPAPLAAHRRRGTCPPGAPLVEGSHWVLLQAAAPGTRQLRLQSLRGPRAWEAALAAAARGAAASAWTPAASPGLVRKLRRHFPHGERVPGPAGTPSHAAPAALWFTQALERAATAVVLATGTLRSGQLLHCGAQAPPDAGLARRQLT